MGYFISELNLNNRRLLLLIRECLIVHAHIFINLSIVACGFWAISGLLRHEHLLFYCRSKYIILKTTYLWFSIDDSYTLNVDFIFLPGV